MPIDSTQSFTVQVNTSPTGNKWYIATTGNNTTGDGSLAKPWATIQKGMDTAVGGDVVYVRGGTYHEHVIITKSGSAGKPITLTNYGSEVVTIDGTGISLSSYNCLLDIGNDSIYPAYITIQNLNVTNSSQCGIGTHWLTGKTSPCHDITVQYCTITNMTYNAIFFCNENGNAMNNINVNHCTMTNIQIGQNTGEGNTFESVSNSQFNYNTIRQCYKICFAVCGTSHDVLIDHNDVDASYICSSCICMGVDGGQTNGQHCDDITFSNNFIHGTGQLLSFTSEIGSATYLLRITFVNNILVVGSGGLGFVTYLSTSQNMCTDVVFKHNTIYTLSGAGDAIQLNGRTNNYYVRFVMANNIIYRVGATRMMNTAFSNGTVTNNLYYSTAGAPTSTGLPLGTSYQNADPKFVTTGTDFHLQSTSPAINNGSSSTNGYMSYTWPTDFDGKTRVAPPDIGAYEY